MQSWGSVCTRQCRVGVGSVPDSAELRLGLYQTVQSWGRVCTRQHRVGFGAVCPIERLSGIVFFQIAQSWVRGCKLNLGLSQIAQRRAIEAFPDRAEWSRDVPGIAELD